MRVGRSLLLLFVCSACAPEDARPELADVDAQVRRGAQAFDRAWQSQSDQNNSNYAAALASGDVDGDGFSDLIVGAPRFDAGGSDQGKVWVHYGSATGLNRAADWRAVGARKHDELGTGV